MQNNAWLTSQSVGLFPILKELSMDKQISPNIKPEPTITPEQVQEAFTATEKKAAEIQELYVQAAQHAGYTREAMRVVAPFFIQLF